MLMICQCPTHHKSLVYWKDTTTHSIFKCPECDYTGGDGVVHHDLPKKYNKLEAENKRLKAALEEYGDHNYFCRIWDNQDCTCGYEEALKG